MKEALQQINILNGLYYGMLALILFILGRSAGLPYHWTFFSVLFCFLFMGTNKFSYFSYYSLGPTCTSMAVYWLWTAFFFFRRTFREVVIGVVTGLLLFPVLWVNHYQEAVFLFFLLVIYILIVVWQWAWYFDSPWRWLVRLLYFVVFITLFFILPQLDAVKEIIFSFTPGRYWANIEKNGIISWYGVHLVAKFWAAFRVNETLGLAGYMPVAVTLIFLVFGGKHGRFKNQGRILILGLLPFFVFCLPLLHLLWGSSVKYGVYYRLGYMSFFWLSVSFFLYTVERKIIVFVKEIKRNISVKVVKSFLFVPCFLGMITLSCVRSRPVYGKTDFLLIDSTIWQQEWHVLIEQLISAKMKNPIVTDYITASVLFGVYGLPIEKNVFKQLNIFPYPSLDVSKLLARSKNYNLRCLINLHGFSPTWVSSETGHWQPEYADTALFYRFPVKDGKKMRPFKETDIDRTCLIFQ